MARTRSIGALLIALAASSPVAAESLRLPCLFGDHMVFQAGKPAVVWGEDKPGQEVAVTLGSESLSVTTDPRGRWKAKLPAPPAGGPYRLNVQGSSTKTFQDVLVGEVWLGSGQSNMEFRLDQTKGGAQAVAQASDPQLRLFLQKPVMSPKLLDEPQGEWKVCSPESAAGFSAVAYHFGRNLRSKLKVPVGLIASSWGGSYAESWTPEKALKKDPAFKPVWKRWTQFTRAEQASWLKGRFPVDLALKNIRLIPRDPSQAPLTLGAESTSSLSITQLGPGKWGSSVKEGSDLKLSVSAGSARMTGSFLGDAWGFMTTALAPECKAFDISAYQGIEFDAKGSGYYILFLSQPSITDWDNYRTPKNFEVTRNWKHHRVLFTELKQSGWGKPKPFTPAAVANVSFGVDPKPIVEIPAALYNGMIQPFTPFPLKGFLWYQGEANAPRPGEYMKLLSTLAESWRQAWGDPTLPFLLAQLPNYVPGPGQGTWPELREAQRQVAALPHNAMAVLLDIGESHDIHPKDKANVGYRLAQEALAMVYEKKDAELCPLFESASAEGKKLRVRFIQTGAGLEAKGGDLKGFEVAGADGKFQPAQGTIEKDSLLVWNEKVAHPQAVRYAWADDPLFNLYGKNGLPASPFKSATSASAK